MTAKDPLPSWMTDAWMLDAMLGELAQACGQGDLELAKKILSRVRFYASQAKLKGGPDYDEDVAELRKTVDEMEEDLARSDADVHGES